VPNCKTFLVTEAERKHVRRRARFQQHRDVSCHQVFFSARQGAEGNSRHSERNIRITCTIVCHRKNWVAQFKRGDFSTCDAPRPGRTKRVFCVANFTVLQRQPIFQASVLIFLRSFGCQSQAYIQTFSFVIRASL